MQNKNDKINAVRDKSFTHANLNHIMATSKHKQEQQTILYLWKLEQCSMLVEITAQEDCSTAVGQFIRRDTTIFGEQNCQKRESKNIGVRATNQLALC